MGLFSKIKKLVKRVAPKPLRKVATGLAKLQPKTLLKFASQGPVLGPINFVAGRTAPKVAPYIQLASDVALAVVGPKIPTGGLKMAFNIGGLLSGIGGALGSVGGANAGVLRGVGAVTSIVGASIAARPAVVRPPAPRPTSPAPRPGVSGGLLSTARGVGQRFFQKYPNLATAIQKYRNAGMSQVTRGRLYSMVRRFGPELIISGGILSAAAVSELMMAGPGTRRMNPANVKALRRSVRRMESFHKLCGTVDKLRRPRSRGTHGRKSCATQFVRQG